MFISNCNMNCFHYKTCFLRNKVIETLKQELRDLDQESPYNAINDHITLDIKCNVFNRIRSDKNA